MHLWPDLCCTRRDRLQGMRVTLLGLVAAVAGGKDLALGGLKQRAVFALLALNAGRVVPLDRLVDELWADEPPSRATLSLQSYVARLRHVLAAVPEGADAPQILTRPPGWLLTLDPVQVDVTRFEGSVSEGRRMLVSGGAVGAAPATRLLEQALELWTGDPLAGLEPVRFAREEAARLNELRLDATELLLQAQLALGETDSVAERARQFVLAHPFRERGWCALMLALYRCGRQSEALSAAARLRRTLAAELGVDPSPEVRRLEEQILRQDAILSSASTDLPGLSGEAPAIDAHASVAVTAAERDPPQTPMPVRRLSAGTTFCLSWTPRWRRPSPGMAGFSFCPRPRVSVSPASCRRSRSASSPTVGPFCAGTASALTPPRPCGPGSASSAGFWAASVRRQQPMPTATRWRSAGRRGQR